MNILIVDDEAGALRDLLRMVKRIVPKAEISTAKNADAALDLCRKYQLDVAFLDIKMPDMDGLALVQEMKKQRPLINIIMVTAYQEYALNALKLYVSDYILKPANPKEIEKALNNLRNPVLRAKKGLYVQCFGNFEVYYDGKPVRFGRTKVKELFAYLIDRRGASVTNAELRAVLWMDEVSDEEKQRKYFAQLVYELQKKLGEMGLDDIFLHSRDSYAIAPEKISCDYFQALERDEQALSQYSGEYMHQYEWSTFS